MSSEREKVEREYKKKLAEADIIDKVRAAVPATNLYTVHAIGLYGTVAHIIYGDSYSGYGAKRPSWNRLRDLIRALPAEPVVLVREFSGGSLSFKTAEYVACLDPEKMQRKVMDRDGNERIDKWDVTYVAPVHANIEALHGPALELRWVTRIEGVGLVDVSVNMGHVPRGLGTHTAERHEFVGGHRYGKASFQPNDGLQRIEIPMASDVVDGVPAVCEIASPIVWAAGSPEYPSRVSVYWHMPAARSGAAVPDSLAATRLIDQIAWLCEPTHTQEVSR